MKKIFYLIGVSTLFLFASCNNDDITQSVPEVKMYTPTMQGTFGEFTDANPAITTKSGVIEDNPDYDDGEIFYWHNGDKVKMLFFANGDINSTPTELLYTAVVPDDEKPGSCEFTTSGSVPAGEYTVYGLYPADGWSRDATGYKASMIAGPDPFIPISEASSKHLGRYMFMKAKAENVVIGEDGPNSIALSYQHLVSVVRLHIRTNNPNPEYSRLYRAAIGINGFGEDENFNPIEAYLNGIDGTSLVAVEATKVNTARVQITNDELNGLEFDLFIPILPTGPFESSDQLSIAALFRDQEGNESSPQPPYLNLPIGSELPFLLNGFEAGRSYYFNLTDTSLGD